MDAEEEKRIAEFLASHHAIAWKIARSFSRDNADCDDLFQEICISLWTAFEKIPSDVAETTYVYRVALNRAISWQRKRNSYVRHIKTYFQQGQATTTSADGAESDETQQLYAAIRQLPESDRSLILMFLDEVGYAEMASILGAAPSTIRKRVSRAKQRLAEIIQPRKENANDC